MSDPRDPGAAARRLAIFAAFLVLPLVLGAFAIPRLVRWLRAAPSATAAPALVTGLAGGPADPRLDGGQPAPDDPAPRRPDGPTSEQIEAASQAEQALAHAQQGWGKSQVLAPRQAVRDASGALVSPFEGFGLSVETQPPGARVLVDGRDLGETPLLASVTCRPGEALALVVERSGWRAHREEIRCRKDTLLTIPITLRR